MLLELESHSITDGQRRFLLESAFIPYLYSDDYGGTENYWPQKIVIELIKALVDVNEPIRRANYSPDYSTWQIFLLWLNEDMSWAFSEPNDSTDFIEVFQAFLSHGADPGAVVTKDLKKLPFEDDGTMGENAALISATELLENGKRIACSRGDMEELIANIDCAQALLANTTQGYPQHR